MVCLNSLKRGLTWVLTLVALLSLLGLSPDSAWARLRRSASAVAQPQDAVIEIQSVKATPDGSGLIFEASRPFTGEDTRYFTMLKLPNPNRALLDIPNARLKNGPAVIPVQQGGIQQVELVENRSPFYSSVRAIVYMQDARALSRVQTAFEGSKLRLETGPPMASAQVAGKPPLPAPAAGKPTSSALQPPLPRAATGKAVPLPPTPAMNPAVVATQAPLPAQATPVTQGVPQANPIPVPPGASVIEDISVRDNSLQVSANHELRIKNRFTLQSPNRLVLDFEDAVLGSRALLQPIAVSSRDIRQIRVGQFDERTVRMVIETAEPDNFEVLYPEGARTALKITPYSGTSVTRLSARTELGYVDQVTLRREGGGTVVRLVSSVPLVHRMEKKEGRIQLELLNVAANPTVIGFDEKIYPELKRMRFEPLTASEPNSQFLIDLAADNVQVVPTLSDDKKTLELQLTHDLNDVVPLITNIGMASGGAGKAPYPARIVLDAGHGGKDKGANRNGVNEKDLNLSLALLVRQALVEKGFEVIMTRSTDEFLPLPTITAITNRNRPDLFISIHHNASTNPAVRGIETYWYTPQSRPLAEKIQRRSINAVGARDGGVKQAMFYVIHHTNVPAVLCEVGYVSNPAELEELQTMERKQKTARAIADGVVDYLKSRISAKAP